jgi:hypothetical protein
MRYMLMCCFDEKRWSDLPGAEKERIMKAYGEWIDDAARSGHLRVMGKLRPTSTATTVRMESVKRIVTDGPFAETREQLGGFHLIECKDLDEAIALAGRIPTLPAGGVVEVRPVELDRGIDARDGLKRSALPA